MTAPAPAPARPRRALVAAAVVLVVGVCGVGAVQLLSQLVSGTVERSSTFVPAAARFAVDADVGDVVLSPSADGRVHVRTVVEHGWGEPQLVEESTPTGLRLDVDCGGLLAARCDVRYTVEVPPEFDVVIAGATGDVVASGLTGRLTVDRSTGDITVLDLAGPLDLRTRTGEITGDALRSEVVRAISDTGDVRLVLATPPRSIDVVSAVGAVDLAVPIEVAYRVDAQTDVGEERVLVPTDPASPRNLRVHGDTGDITLRPSR